MRLDKYLVEKKYFSSRARAKEAIEHGGVFVGGVAITSADMEISDGTQIEVKASFPWVSRGALKLISALDTFHIDPTGLIALDLGASTGGFTEVLLSRGAVKVYSVDVGHGQLHSKLVADARVVNMEGLDARDVDHEQLSPRPDLIVGDLSFISLSKVFPTMKKLMTEGMRAILLVKPQFEVGVGGTKKGIVREEDKQQQALQGVLAEAQSLGFVIDRVIESPVRGGSGNIEFLIALHV